MGIQADSARVPDPGRKRNFFYLKALSRWMETHHIRQRDPLVSVVDDEKDIRETIGLFLEQDGYRVALAATGRDALDTARHETPDAVLLDLVRPGMSGVEVFKNPHAMNPDIPVIIVTGYPDSDLVAKAVRYPPVMLLAKPVEKTAQLRRVRRVLHGSTGIRRESR